MDPLVSFIVPCYELAHLLPECIDSILAQSYPNFEVLIMDNCSPDNTPEVANSFHDPRVKHIRNEVNLGHLRNFNKGIGMAGGKYVWLISADDFLLSPDVLRRYVDLMEQHSRVGYVFCRARNVHEGKQQGVAQWADCGEQDRIWKAPAFLGRLIKSNCIVMSSCMVRKECYDTLSVFPLDMPYSGDWYLWCTFALHYAVAYLAEPMVGFREHEASLTASFNRETALICIADELSVEWQMGRQAELAGDPALSAACTDALVHRAAYALRAKLRGEAHGMGDADFETILRSRIQDRKTEREICARVYTGLADLHFWDGEYIDAAQSYSRGLRLGPWQAGIWVKYLLLRLGAPGIWLRRVLRQRRRSCVEQRYA